MKQTSTVLAAALFLVLPSLAIAEDTPAGQSPTPAAQEAAKPTPKVNKAMMPEAPPAELKKLSMLQGSWTSKMHMYASPMGPESTSPARSTYNTTFNGMHVEGNHQFQMAGKPCFGRSTWGWDPEKQQYQIVWVDAMYPAAFVYYGTFANDNTLVLNTTYMMQGKTVSEKMTYAFSDPDTYTMTMESDISGEMKPLMEETGTRVKGATKSVSKKTTTTTTTTKKSG